METTEQEEAEKIARAILNGDGRRLFYNTIGPHADPDDDAHILARQFLRLVEMRSLRVRYGTSWFSLSIPDEIRFQDVEV